MSDFRPSFPVPAQNNGGPIPDDDQDAPTGRLERVTGWPYDPADDRLPGTDDPRTEQFPSVAERRPEAAPGRREPQRSAPASDWWERSAGPAPAAGRGAPESAAPGQWGPESAAPGWGEPRGAAATPGWGEPGGAAATPAWGEPAGTAADRYPYDATPPPPRTAAPLPAWEDPYTPPPPQPAAPVPAWEDPQSRTPAWEERQEAPRGRHSFPEPPAADPWHSAQPPQGQQPFQPFQPATAPAEQGHSAGSAFWGTPEPAPAEPQRQADDGWSFWERPKTARPAPAEPRPSWEEIVRLAREEQEAAEREAAEQERLEQEREAARARRPRDPYLDNAKFILIALVVIGHSLVPTLKADSARSLYLFIYVFHMPLFVIISGYLSRNFWNSNAKTNKLVDTFLVPYVIVEVGYALLRVALGQKWSLTIMDPAWLNWYLLALLLWRLSTPVWKRMRHPLAFALAVYLLSGLADLSGDFSIDRFFTLMPFFVLGLTLQPHHFEWLNQLWVKIAAVFVLIGGAAVAIYLAPKVKLAPIYFKNDYATLGLTWWEGMGQRMALLVAALLMSASVLALIPRRHTWFSDLGTRTLYAYLLHGVPVLIAKEMGWLSFPWMYGPLGVAAISAMGFLLAVILCLPQTRAVFKYLIEPRLTWLYRRPSVPAAQPAAQAQQPAQSRPAPQGQQPAPAQPPAQSRPPIQGQQPIQAQPPAHAWPPAQQVPPREGRR